MPQPWEMDWGKSAAAPADASRNPWEMDWKAEKTQQPQSTLQKVGSAIADRFNNPPNEMSLIGMAGRAYKAFTDPLPKMAAPGLRREDVSDDPNAPQPNEPVINRAMDIAETAGPISAGSAIRRGVVSPVPPKAVAPTVEQLKKEAVKGYESPEVSGLTIKTAPLQSWSNDVRTALTDAGLDGTVADKTWKILGKLDGAPEGSFVTGKNLETLRKTLGQVSREIDPARRMPTPDAAAASKAMEALNELYQKLPESDIIAGDPTKALSTLKEANANYSAAGHAQTIDKKQVRAELRAAAANSGQNVANSLRQRVADILINEKEKRGFSPEEIAQMETIVRGTGTQNAMRVAGNVMGGGGGLMAGLYGLGALATHGAVGLAPIVGYGIKKLSNFMTENQVTKLSEMVRSNSPLGRKMNAPLADWAAKSKAFDASPSVQNFARMNLAARNLATNLKDAGLPVSQNDIVRGAQGPMKASPQDEQP